MKRNSVESRRKHLNTSFIYCYSLPLSSTGLHTKRVCLDREKKIKIYFSIQRDRLRIPGQVFQKSKKKFALLNPNVGLAVSSGD